MYNKLEAEWRVGGVKCC